MIEEDADTFRNARLWDYRPLATTLDQLQTHPALLRLHRRRHGPLHRSTASSARSCSPRASSPSTRTRTRPAGSTSGSSTPTASAWPWSRSTRWPTRASRGCSSATCRRSRPPAPRPSTSRGSTSASGRPRTSITGRAKQLEFDYPTGAGRGRRRPTGRRRAGPGRPGSASTRRCVRLLFALRFRDLDLLISDQVTPAEPAALPPLPGRPADHASRRSCTTTRTRTSSSTTPGELVYVQDAYTVSDRFPHAQSFDPGELPRQRAGRARRSTTSATASRSRWTPTTGRCTSTSPTRPTRSSAPTRASSRRCSSRSTALPADLRRPPARARGAVQRPDPGLRARTTSPIRSRSSSSDDLWTVPQGQTSEQTLPSEAYYVIMRMPGESEAEFLLLQPMVPHRAGRT